MSHKNHYKEDFKLFELFKTALLDYYKLLNQLIYLMTINQNAIFFYLKIYHLVNSLKIVDAKKKQYSELRFIFDELLKLTNLNPQNHEFAIYFASRYSPHLFYFNKERLIMDFLYSKVAKDWVKSQETRFLGTLIFSLTHYPSPPDYLTQRLPEILSLNNDLHVKFRGFVFMVEWFMIDKDTIESPHYVSLIRAFAKEIPEKTIRILSKMFYLA